MKKFSVKTIVAIGIGAALFFVLGRFVAIPSPVPNTSISVQYGLLAFLSVVYGPVAGALVGFIGHTLIDFSYGWGVWWSWVIASAVFGLLMGLAAKTMKMEEGELGKKGLIKFNISQLVCHLICWLAVAPVLDVYMMGEPWDKLIAQGLMAAIANAVTTAIVGSLLCVAYTATKTKAGSLTKEYSITISKAGQAPAFVCQEGFQWATNPLSVLRTSASNTLLRQNQPCTIST